MLDYRLIGKRIKLEREKAGYTQEYIAEKADITVIYLSKIENGHAKPTLDTISNICDSIDTDIGKIFTGVNTKKNDYQTNYTTNLLNSCRPEIKPIAIELLEKLSKI